MCVQCNLRQAANAPPKPLYWLRRLCAAFHLSEHVLGRKQRPGHEGDARSLSSRFVFCWSQALVPKTLDLSLAQLIGLENGFRAPCRITEASK